jgi:hypothetical protein
MPSLEQMFETHDREDKERFENIHLRFDNLPEEMKLVINGSVEDTINRRFSGMMRWLGVGAFIVLVSFATTWGKLSNQVQTNKEDISSIKINTRELKELNNKIDILLK